MPKVSVVMSCYNEEQHVSKAIESILSQTFDAFEFIIVDDGSHDQTKQIIETFQAKDKRIKFLINSNNLGLAASLNKGISQSKGKYIARMDADDISHTDRLEKQVYFLDKNPEIDILGSNAEMIKGKEIGLSNVPTKHKDIVASLFSKTSMIHPTVMIKKSCFDKEGYDDKLPWAEDKDLWLRWKDNFSFANLESYLLKYTVKDKITWRIFYYNHLVLIKNMWRQKTLISQSPPLLKSVVSHLVKMIKL